MRGEAEIDAKSSKIDDQKIQNSLIIRVFPHLCYRSLVLLNDGMLMDGKNITCPKIYVNPRLLSVHYCTFDLLC
jgi:hypothetical protein